MLDDFGKESTTERVQSELYHVIEQRIAARRPVFGTMQLGRDEFAARMSADKGGAILRRLDEKCTLITLQ